MAKIVDPNIFKEADRPKAEENLNQFENSLQPVFKSVTEANFSQAATSLRNAANYMDNLASLQNEKAMLDEAAELLKKINAEEARRNWF
ncbi:hypothetical protein BN988_01632 [Oceanobacillus picturae]|uniref:Uncharacterized protein n=1 Tax=Oceanobacillus picturae TaxID=171693 RepID=W9AJR4_9BACI|nr:hypothetical protein [Oceanobacillus picturae]CDO03132.1 hypothetical protein BN988_01632 [Oceanobacillus picturae]